MNNTIKILITCRFAPWFQLDEQYPAYGVKYILDIPIYCEDAELFFKEKYKNTIGKEFEGEVLFTEELDATIL